MAVGLGFRGALFAFGEETSWGVEVPRLFIVCMTSDGLGTEEELLLSENINRRYYVADEMARSKVTAGGDFESEVRYNDFDILYKNVMGSVITTEVPTFVVDITNQFIDFKEDAGGELNATVANNTYILGENSSTAGSLCEAIKIALELVSLGTYLVEYSFITKLLTITVSGSVSNFQLLWQSGTHGSSGSNDNLSALIGFDDSADTANLIFQISDNPIDVLYTNTYNIVDIQQEGLSIEVLLDNTLPSAQSKLYIGGMINSIDFSIETAGFLTASFNIIAKDESLLDVETVTALTYAPARLITFDNATVEYNGGVIGAANSFNFTINNTLNDDRMHLGTLLVDKPVFNGKAEITGTVTIEFENRDKYDDFRNNTTVAISVKFVSPIAIRPGFFSALEFVLPTIKLTGITPQISDEGIITLEIPFQAGAQSDTIREAQLITTNITNVAPILT